MSLPDAEPCGWMVLSVPGEPRGKGRPRFSRHTGGARTHTDARTLTAEAEVKDAWWTQGRPWLGDGPLIVRVVARFARPSGHFRANGELSAAGLRSPAPAKKPDADNILKLLADALNGLAWRDDAQIADVQVVKEWAPEHPGLVIHARRWDVVIPVREAERVVGVCIHCGDDTGACIGD